MAQTAPKRTDGREPEEDRSIVTSRILNAPRELVFEVWTSPQHVPHWWGPNGFTITTEKMDVRPGGEWLFTMHGPDGTDYPNKVVYTEIHPPDRLMYIHGDPDDTSHFETTVTMEAVGSKQTQLTMRAVFPTVAAKEFVIREFHAIEGANQTLGRLADHLEQIVPAGSGDPSGGFRTKSSYDLVITRTFDAPRDLVFDCWTQPTHLQHWQGAPKGFTVTIQESDIRPGGHFRICMRSPAGVDHWLQGEYREVVRPERIVFSHTWLDAQGKPADQTLVTVQLKDTNGKTELTLTQADLLSIESLNGHKAGWVSALDVLTNYLKTIRS